MSFVQALVFRVTLGLKLLQSPWQFFSNHLTLLEKFHIFICIFGSCNLGLFVSGHLFLFLRDDNAFWRNLWAGLIYFAQLLRWLWYCQLNKIVERVLGWNQKTWIHFLDLLLASCLTLRSHFTRSTVFLWDEKRRVHTSMKASPKCWDSMTLDHEKRILQCILHGL